MADQHQLSHSARIFAMNRRAFLHLAGLTTGALMLGGVRPVAGGQVPAQVRGTRLSYLQWQNFVPAHDAVIRQQIAAFERQSGIKVTLETINQNDIQARTTVAIENKAGPDVI